VFVDININNLSITAENNRGGAIYYGKFLDNKKGFKASSSSVLGRITKEIYTFNTGYIWHLIEDLSEIQHLLPDSHEDKIKTSLLPEKWCLKVDTDNIDFISRERYSGLSVTGFIHSKLNDNTSNFWYYDSWPVKGYTEITLDQFKQYVLKIEPKNDLVPIGSCFVVTEACSGKFGTKNYCYKRICPSRKTIIPEFYYISDYDAVDTIKVKVRPATLEETTYYEQKAKGRFNIEVLKAVIKKPEEQPLEEILEICKKKYPIGTKIKGIDSNTVETIERELIIQYEGISYPGLNFVYYDGKYAEIIELPKKSTSDDFKIGDIVVVTERYSNNIPVGSVSELIELDIDSIISYKLKYSNISRAGWCKNIRKATSTEEAEYRHSQYMAEGFKEAKLNDSVTCTYKDYIPQGDGIVSQIERPTFKLSSDIIEIKKIKTFTK
jgi:hypothetical protein